ncbi:MAG: hypothetical protein RIQ43_1038, partial [Pseudomonadota bacterium]
MAKFFIDRPVFAIVISLFLVLAGTLTLIGLPVAQYPNIALPKVNINAFYPGADAAAVQQGVAAVLDQKVNGVTAMKSIQSTSGDDGSSSIAVTFELERDPDIAAVEVQNRVALATASLPPEVRDMGISVVKSSPDTLLYATVFSPKQ